MTRSAVPAAPAASIRSPSTPDARNGVVTIEASFGVDDETAGSGFVVDARRGLIVTASHVVARRPGGGSRADGRASAVHIVLDDGTRADAQAARLRPLRGHGAAAGRSEAPRAARAAARPRALAARRRRRRRDRQPVREPRVALDRRRLPARPPDHRARRVLPHDRRRSRPTRPSTPATRAARCSTRAARSSAWSPRSTRTRTAASPTRCRSRPCERAYRALAAGKRVPLRLARRLGRDRDARARRRTRPRRRARRPRARPEPGRRRGARRLCRRGAPKSRSPARPIRATATSSSPSERRPSRASATSTARSPRIARATASTCTSCAATATARRRRAPAAPPARASPTAADGAARYRTRDTIASRRGHRPHEGGRVASDQRDGRVDGRPDPDRRCAQRQP